MNDIIKNAYKKPLLTKFLTLEEQKDLLNKGLKVIFSDENRERKRAYLSIDKSFSINNDINSNEIDFKINTIKINYNKKFDCITHPMILGAILGLGIDRSCVGDIIFEKKDDKIINVYVLIISEMTNFLISEFNKIGHVNVSCEKVSNDVIKNILDTNYYEKNIIVSSLRIDTIVSNIANLSREKSKDYITLKNVKINGNICLDCDYVVKIDDIISIHRYGRTIIKEIIKKTKKDKFVLLIKKTR